MNSLFSHNTRLVPPSMPICRSFSSAACVPLLLKEPADSLATDGPVPNNEQAEEKTSASKVSRGVLDFSSGSEEDEEEQGLKRKASSPSAMDGNGGGNAVTGPGRMSLLQHGFSRLLERLKGKPELAEGESSPAVDESPSEEEAEDQKMESTSSGIAKNSKTRNRTACFPKLGPKTWDFSSSSDGEDPDNRDKKGQERFPLLRKSHDVRKTEDRKGRANEKTPVAEESYEKATWNKNKPNKLKTPVPKVSRFEGYSDESDDLAVEAKTWPRRDALNSHGRRGRERLDRNRKRQSAGVRDEARLKYTEDIETFTSSDDEHTPVKKGRATGSRFTSPPTERSRDESAKYSFTNLKNRTSPAGRDGTIDSVLGETTYHQRLFVCILKHFTINFDITDVRLCVF